MRTSLLLLLLSTLSLPLWAANILVIQQLPSRIPVGPSYNKGLLDGLQGEHKITHFYMDTNAIHGRSSTRSPSKPSPFI